MPAMTELTDERREAILTLLRTRNDGLPDATGQQRRYAAGFKNRIRVTLTCEDCLTNDRRMNGCETCGGRGYRDEWRSVDPYAITNVQPYGIDPTKHDARRARDIEIDRLDAQTAQPPATEADALAEANQHPYGWEAARAAMYRDYDYAELERALDWLRMTYSFADPYSDFGLAMLSSRLPDELRAPGFDVRRTASGPSATV